MDSKWNLILSNNRILWITVLLIWEQLLVLTLFIWWLSMRFLTDTKKINLFSDVYICGYNNSWNSYNLTPQIIVHCAFKACKTVSYYVLWNKHNSGCELTRTETLTSRYLANLLMNLHKPYFNYFNLHLQTCLF